MNRIFLGIKNTAVCIDKKTGEILWRTKLKGSSAVTNIYLDEADVIVYSGGHLFCLDMETGRKKWSNPLKGLGYGNCIIAGENNAAAVAAAQSAQAAAAAGASAAATVAATS